MTIGDGIFWAGLLYAITRIIELGIIYFVSHFPDKNIGRIDRIEQIIKDSGMDI